MATEEEEEKDEARKEREKEATSREYACRHTCTKTGADAIACDNLMEIILDEGVPLRDQRGRLPRPLFSLLQRVEVARTPRPRGIRCIGKLYPALRAEETNASSGFLTSVRPHLTLEWTTE